MQNKPRGTPKTMRDAIHNGLEDAYHHEVMEPYWNPELESILEMHVKDYLSQAFTAAAMRNDTILDLWARLASRK